MALLEGLPRSANAQAVDDVALVEVDAETFEQMIRTNSEIAVRMMRGSRPACASSTCACRTCS